MSEASLEELLEEAEANKLSFGGMSYFQVYFDRSVGTDDPTWQRISLEDIAPRALHTSTLFDHHIITIGGKFGPQKSVSKQCPQIEIFNTLTYKLEKPILTGIQFQSRWGHTACLFDDKIVIYGGSTQGKRTPKRLSSEVLIMTIIRELDQGISLHLEQIPMKKEDPAKGYHTAEIFGNKIYVFAGVDDKNTLLNELWSLDLENFRWTKCEQKGNIPSPRLGHASAIIDNKMYIFGGRTNIKPLERMNDLFCLDLDNLHWSQVHYSGEESYLSSGMTLTQHRGLLYIFGGKKGPRRFSGRLFSVDLKKNEVKENRVKNKYPSWRNHHTMIPCEHGIFLYGGEGKDLDKNLSDIFYLNLVSTQKEKRLCELQEQVSHLYLNRLYSDVVFLIEGEKIFAHKTILTIHSMYFSKMFSSNMLESNQKEIEIPDCKLDTFKAFLRYLYCSEVELTEELALDLLFLSDKWLCKELETECEDFLINTLMFENIISRAELAEKFGIKRLSDSVVEFIIENKIEMEKSRDLEKIHPSLLVKAIVKLQKEFVS